MTLVAFLPILSQLSTHLAELPIFGKIPNSLVVISVVWSLLGTLYVIFLGRKLPGQEFSNQRVEAAYRKELVYGEDDENRASFAVTKHLFDKIKNNYFKLYYKYLYFNLGPVDKLDCQID